jgi:hypothetical protein
MAPSVDTSRAVPAIKSELDMSMRLLTIQLFKFFSRLYVVLGAALD